MTKTEAIKVLEQLEPTEKVRLIIDFEGLNLKADSTQTADYLIYWLKNDFYSPCEVVHHLDEKGNTHIEIIKDSQGEPKELSCIKLESSSFAFALAYNSVMEKVETPKEVEYTKEQQEQMFALHYETTQQNHVGYLETSKGE